MKAPWISRLFHSCSPFNAFLSLARRQRKSVKAALAVEHLEERQMLTPVSWISPNDGFWDDQNNWSTGQVPGFGDDVTIDVAGATPVITIRDFQRANTLISRESLVVAAGGTFRMDGAAQIELSTLTVAGALEGGGPLTIAGTADVDWAGGVIAMSSVVNAGTLTISAPADVRLGGTLTNSGNIVHSGAGNLLFDGSTKLVNNPLGVYDFTGDGDIGRSNQGAGFNPFFQNDGTLRKSAGAGVSDFIDLNLQASATAVFDVDSGRLKISSNSSADGSSFTGSAGGVFEIGGSLDVTGNITGTGNGHLELTGTLKAVSTGATINFPDGYFQWVNGILVGVSPLTNAGVIELSAATDVRLSGQFFNNGTFLHSGAGSLLFDGSSKIVNNAAGIYEFSGDGDIARSNQGAGFGPFIDNAGLFTKTAGADVSQIGEISFNNLATGTVDAEAGRLRISSSGDWQGATLTADATGVVELAGNVNTTGNLIGDGTGHVELTGGVTGNGVSLDFDEGYFQWVSGGLNGTGAGITIVDSLEVAGASDKTAFGRLNVPGTIEHTGTGRLLLNTNGSVIIAETGVYDFQGAGGWGRSTIGGGAQPFFEIRGTLRKSAGNNTALIDGDPNTVDINVTGGTIDVQAGRLRIDEAGEWRSGAEINVATGAVLEFTGSATILMEGTFTGTGGGRVEVGNGALTSTTFGVGGAHATLDFEPGLLHWLRGGIAGAGSAMVNIGTITTEGPDEKGTFGNGLINQGTIIHSGVGRFNTNGAVVENRSGAVWEFRDDAPFNGTDQFGNAGRLLNSGLITKSSGAGKVTINTRLENAATGVIDVSAGTLEFSRGGGSTGATFTISAGTTLSFTGNDVFDWNGSFTGTGLGDIEFDSFLRGGDPNAAVLDFPVGMFHMNSGQLLGSIVNEGWFDFAPTGGLFARAGITNNDTWVHSGAGDFVLNANSSFVNNGLYDLQTDADLVVPGDASGGSMRFTNNGVLQKSGGLGTSAFRHDGSNKELRFDNSGIVEVLFGTLSFNDTVVQSSGSTLLGGTWIVDEFSTLTMPGSGNFTINQSTVELNGQAANFTNFSGLTTNQGSLTITDGGNFPSTGAFTNSGELTVGPDSLLTVNGNYTQSSFDQLVSWWRGEGNFTDSDGGQNGTVSGNTTFATGQFGQAFSFDGTRDYVTLTGTPTLTNFSISAWIRRDNLSKAGTIFSGTNNYAFGILANGQLFLEASSSPQLTSGPLAITDSEFHHVAVTRDGRKVTFYVDGVAQEANGFTPFSGMSPFLIGAIINDASRDFQGLIDEVALFNRPLSAADVVKLKNTNNAQSVGTIIPELNIGISDRPGTGEFGRVNITGAANLSGRLNIDLENGFGPTLADQYTILSYASRNGSFNQIGGLNPFFDINVGATQTTLNVVASAADIAVQSVNVPPTASPGESITIQYTVQNLDNINAPGTWTDSLYLSVDGQFDPSDLLIGRVTHTGGIGPLGTYTESLTALLPGVVDGNYRVIVVADSRGDVGDTNRDNNKAASASQIAVDLPVLDFNTLTSLNISPNEDIYLKLDVPFGGDVLVTANFQNALQSEFFIRQGALPTRSEFDFVASDLTDLSRTITLASPIGGAYYILLHGREGATGGVNLSLLAEHIAFDLQSVSPSRGSNLGSATTVLTGAGFTADTVVELLDGLGNAVATATTRLINPNRLFATFNLIGVAAGTYDVRATDDALSDTVADAYQVVVGAPGHVSVDVVVPGSVRGGRLYTGYVTYTNTGDTDVVAPILFLDSSSVFTLDLTQDPSELTDLFLAISPEGPAGILAPGQSVRVPFRFFGNNMTIEALSMSPDETALMDWEELRNEIRPDDADAEWDEVFDERFVGAGTTVGDYVRLMAETATLYQLHEGETTSDLAVLQGFLIAEGFADREAVIRGRLFLDDPNRPSGRIVVTATNRATGDVQSVVATADGLVRIGHLTPGTYDLTFLDVLPPTDLQPVVVPGVGLPPEQTWIVHTGGGIVGRVGVPVGVVLLDVDQEIQQTVSATDEDGNVFTAGVDETGFYQFSGLPAGKYDLTFRTSSTLPVTVLDVDVQLGHNTGFIDLFSVAGGTITGVVRDADTNQPVANVSVSTLDDTGNPRTAVTNANGVYTLTGVTPGTVSIGVTSPGLVSNPLTNITLATGQTVSNANLTADFGALGSITGNVTAGGNPVANAAVDILQNGTLILATTSTAQGTFTLPNVIPGTYTLSIRAFGFQDSETSVTVGDGEDLVRNVSLDAASIVSGVVKATGSDESGTPIDYVVPGLELMLVTSDGDTLFFDTDADGTFEVGNLSPGDYQLMLADGSHRQTFQIVGAADHVVLNFNVISAAIGGILDGFDDELIGVDLQKDGVTVASTSVGENGAFYFTYVAPGTYDVQITSSSRFFPPITGVTVTAGNVTDLGDIAAPAPASASITFTDAVTHLNITTEGIAGLQPVDSALGTTRLLAIDATGVVNFANLVPGDYILEGALHGYPLTKKLVTVSAGTNNLSLDMAVGGTLSGQATDDLATPLAGASITIIDSVHPELRWAAVTDEDGNYGIDLRVGTYTIVVADLRDDVPAAMHLAHVQFNNVVVTQGATTTQNAQLTIGPATIMGTLNGSSIDPVNTAPLNGKVTLTTPDGVPVAQTTADEDGNFTFEGIATGDYIIQTTAGGFAFAPLTVTGVQFGTNAGNDPAGVWVTPSSSGNFAPPPEVPIPDDFAAMLMGLSSLMSTGSGDELNANFVGSDDGLAVDLQFDSLQGFLSKGRALIADFLREPHQEDRITNARFIPDDCPEALSAFKRVLQAQKIADGFFEGWHMRWQATVEVAFANLGLAGTRLLELAASLLGKPAFFSSALNEATAATAAAEQVLMKSIADPTAKISAALAEFEHLGYVKKAIAEIFNADVEAAKAAITNLKGGIKFLKTPSVLLKDLTSVADVGHAIASTDFSGVKPFFGSLINIGDKMLNLTLSLAKTADTLIGIIKVFREVTIANPAMAKLVDQLGPILSAIDVVRAAAQGGMDGFKDILDLNAFQERYERAILLRNAAFESFLDILENCEHDDHKKSKKPNRPRTREQLRRLFLVQSTDPNDIIGPDGGGPQHAMRVDELFPYHIDFQNLPTATAPAQEVVITQQLDSDLDWSTFELGDFGFGDLIVDVPEGRNFYQTRIDLTETLGYFVDFTAGIDLNTGIVTWRLTTIDPETGDLPADALAGFLPPDDASGQGQGFVDYLIKVKQTLTTGDIISAQASIVFDDNAPLLTPIYTNLIDTGIPTSTVNPLAATQDFPSFLVSWTGTDDAVGPTGGGVATFDVFVSDNGGPFTPFLLGTTLTSATFIGQVNHTYSFYSVATDYVGFLQTTPQAAQTSTQVLDVLFDFGDAPDPLSGISGNYPTLLANDGARHLLGSGLLLGSTVDREFDGQPNATATGDDTAGAPDDEDGVVLAGLIRGQSGSATVTASQAGKLDAWIDFNRDGDWNDAGEQIATGLAVAAGSNNVTFNIPALASLGNTFARFRLSSAGGLTPTGQAADGEVEDYQVSISNPFVAVNGQAVEWVKKQPPVNVLPIATVSATGLGGGTLTINVNAVGTKKKVLDLFNFGSFAAVGTSSGPQFANGQLTLQIQLAANVTNNAIQTFLRGITFSTKGKGLKAATRTLSVTLAKTDGSTSTATQTINVRKK